MNIKGFGLFFTGLLAAPAFATGQCHIHSQLGTLTATELSPQANCIQRTDNYLAAPVVNGQGQFENAGGVEGIEVYKKLEGLKSCRGFIEYLPCVDDDRPQPPPQNVICHYYPELDKVTLSGLETNMRCAQLVSGQATALSGENAELSSNMKVGIYQTLQGNHCEQLITTVECSKEGQPPVNDLYISGWYNDGWNASSHAVYTNNVDLFSEINPYWYNLGTSDDSPGNEDFDGSVHERDYVYSAQMVRQAREHGTKVLPSVGDAYINGIPQVNRICTNHTARHKLFDNLVQIAQSRHYDGWDLNFEAVDFNQDYVDCMNALANTLHQHHLELSLTIKPKVPNLVKELVFIDRFKTMQYDNFDKGHNTVAPINPLPWIEHNIQILLAQGVPAKKLQLGIANYGWEWRIDNGQSRMLFPFRPYNYFKDRTGGQKEWDNDAQEWFSRYVYLGTAYKAYYSDHKTVMARVQLARQYHLLGITFWVLGKEDPQIYPKIRELLQQPIKKRGDPI